MCLIQILLIAFSCFHVHGKVNLHEINEMKLKDNKMPDLKSKISLSELEEKRRIVQEYSDSLLETQKNWVDPHDIAGYGIDFETQFSSKQKIKVISESDPELIISEKAINYDVAPKESTLFEERIFPNRDQDKCAVEDIYLSRWLKIMASKMENNDNSYPVSLILPFSSEMMSRLTELSSAKSVKLSEFDEFLSSFLRDADIKKGLDYYWNLYALYIIIGFSIILGLIAVCTIQKCASRHPFFSIAIVIFIISVFWHWMHLYQKQIAHKHHQLSSKAPLDCQVSEFSIVGHIYASFKRMFVKDDCGKYYEALMVNPIWEVSLTVAITETLAAMFFQPLYSGSRALNSFFNTLFDDLPIHVMIFVASLLFLLLMMRNNYKVKLPFFLGALEPAGIHYKHIEEVKSPSVAQETLQKTFSQSIINESLSNTFCDSLQNINYNKETSVVQNKILENRLCSKEGDENLPNEPCDLLQNVNADCSIDETCEKLSICSSEQINSDVAVNDSIVLEEQKTGLENSLNSSKTQRTPEYHKADDMSEESSNIS